MRAIYVPLVHDEAATFFHYIHFGRFLPFFSHWDANNHILNSALASLTYSAFGQQEWALRLPNVLAFVLYATGVWRLSKHLQDPKIRVVFALALLTPHYLIEFFALARGYGLSMGFLLVALAELAAVCKSSSRKNHIWVLVWLLLALAANLTLFNTVGLVVAIIMLNVLWFRAERNKALLTVLLLGILPLAGFALLLLKMKSLGLLYYGIAEAGFWELTAKTLLMRLTNSDGVLVQIILGTLITILAGVSIYLLTKGRFKPSFSEPWLVFALLFLGNVVGFPILHHLLGVNYPEDRVGLYFIPILLVSICFICDKLLLTTGKKWVVVMLIPLLFFPFHFVFSINTTHSSFWKDERIPTRFYERLKQELSAGDRQVTMAGSVVRQMCWAWLNLNQADPTGNMQVDDFESAPFDYLIASELEVPDWRAHYDSLDFDPHSQLLLLRNNGTQTQQTPFQNLKIKPTITRNEFEEFLNAEIDTLSMSNIKVNLQIDLRSLDNPLHAWLVVTTEDREGNLVQYEYSPLDWMKTNWEENNQRYQESILLHNLYDDVRRLKIYLWNMERAEIQLLGGTLELISL